MTDRSDLTQRITAVLCEHVYGDRGPVAGHPEALSVCTRAAEDLCGRFFVSPQPDIDKVAEAIRQADAEYWEEEPHFNMRMARVYAGAAIEAMGR